MDAFVFRYEGALIASRSVEPDESVVDAVNRFTLRKFSRDEFAVFRLDLCHNQIDKHHSRFPEEELEKISAMVVGRPLLERHDLRGALPRGIFFASSLRRDGDKLTVQPDVYVLRTEENRDFILNIEGGVYRETSIGFSFKTPECSVCGKDLRTCDHVPGRSYDGESCHYIMRDVLEVIEGSVVSSGSQGTGFIAQGDEPEQRALSVMEALACARETYRRPGESSRCRIWASE